MAEVAAAEAVAGNLTTLFADAPRDFALFCFWFFLAVLPLVDGTSNPIAFVIITSRLR